MSTFVCNNVKQHNDINLSICRKTLLVQFSNKASVEQQRKYHVPVCLKKVRCVTLVETVQQQLTLV